MSRIWALNLGAKGLFCFKTHYIYPFFTYISLFSSIFFSHFILFSINPYYLGGYLIIFLLFTCICLIRKSFYLFIFLAPAPKRKTSKRKRSSRACWYDKEFISQIYVFIFYSSLFCALAPKKKSPKKKGEAAFNNKDFILLGLCERQFIHFPLKKSLSQPIVPISPALRGPLRLLWG